MVTFLECNVVVCNMIVIKRHGRYFDENRSETGGYVTRSLPASH